MRYLVAYLTAALIMLAQMAGASSLADRLYQVLELDQTAQTLQEEAAVLAASVQVDFLGGRGGKIWRDKVVALHDPDLVRRYLIKALESGLSEEEGEAVIAYFSTPQGQRILTDELAARAFIIDPLVEERARADYHVALDQDLPRLKLIEQLDSEAGLQENNLSSALEANIAFLQGMASGGAYPDDSDMILSDVQSQYAELQQDTHEWLYAYMLMAYDGLSEQEFGDYLDFVASPAGKAMNAALFVGFNALYRETSYLMGRMVAEAMTSDAI